MLPYQAQSPETIRKMFGKIAPSYDKGNMILSCNKHHSWNRTLAKGLLKGTTPECILDLCCGTGELTQHFLQLCPTLREITGIDFCPEMLEVAKEKFPENPPCRFIEGDAEAIPLEDNSVDLISISYGIRNVQTPSNCLKECYRVLKPGGRLGILELTCPTNPLLKGLHKVYLNGILPLVGGLISRDKNAYQYLSKSIQQFILPKDLLQKIEEQEFQQARAKALMGGISHLFFAEKQTF